MKAATREGSPTAASGPQTETTPAPPFLRAEWIHLAMINYAIDPAILRPRVPVGTELDDWNGRHFVSLVGFRFLRTRVMGIPIPFHRDFDEVNLRFYVRRETPNETRRGVVFIKEIVPRAAVAWLARLFYNENYVAAPMRSRIELHPNDGGRVVYAWHLCGRSHRIGIETQGTAYLPPVISEEAFITEHYWGYARQPDGSTLEYRVDHPRWRLWRAGRTLVDCDVRTIYGREFGEALDGEPATAFVADGSRVSIGRGRLIG